jgi:hypothetical protein
MLIGFDSDLQPKRYCAGANSVGVDGSNLLRFSCGHCDTGLCPMWLRYGPDDHDNPEIKGYHDNNLLGRRWRPIVTALNADGSMHPYIRRGGLPRRNVTVGHP